MGGSLPSHSVGGGSLPSHPLAGGGSLGTPGRTMRDYDETFKEMKKENFNLKLRIFFLEVSFASGQKLHGVGRLIVNLTFSSREILYMPECKLKCQKTWWDGMGWDVIK